ncbi:FAD:protein FMN transferase [Bacillus sp. V3B]|uniref:FAD:protein FMN transferase n=1 Tax=Bacillus sp. V3B TaxID=2804915 RepID=UPI00210E5389|nr:FAD:protein FMN transferase [Bacillus sp. V3B]MCQ6274514.1 FAD:protein FMN transferase [Bacillus sp. V3B]
MKRKGILPALLMIMVLLAGCGKDTETVKPELTTNPYKKTEFLMGTIVTVKVYDTEKEAVLEPVLDRIKTLADQITVSEEESGLNIESEIKKVNDKAGIEPVKVSEDIYKLIDAGMEYSIKSNGSYDVSIGPLTSLWHIGYDDARKPAQSEIDAVLPLIDYEQVELNKKEQTVFLQKKDMELDLGSIAKGFIADEVVDILKENNVTTAIIDLGGNIIVMGNHPSGKEWTVGIQNPFSSRGETIGKISESNQSIVTSGIYERFLEVDGETYHHLLNPEDGYPFHNDIAGVSIVSDKSIDGDGLSTSIFSKGIEDGIKFIEQFKGAEAIFVSQDKKVYITSGLKETFELTNDEFKIAKIAPS